MHHRRIQVIRTSGEPLPTMSFHRLRHCAASLMLAPGSRHRSGQQAPWHASISITADVYGHLVGTVASEAVNGAANLIAHGGIGWSADVTVTERLLDHLDDPDPSIRHAIVRALASRQEPGLTQELLNCLDDPDPSVRRAVAEALAGRQGPGVTDRLLASRTIKPSSSVIVCSACRPAAQRSGREHRVTIRGQHRDR
jgi:HEAT repeats